MIILEEKDLLFQKYKLKYSRMKSHNVWGSPQAAQQWKGSGAKRGDGYVSFLMSFTFMYVLSSP